MPISLSDMIVPTFVGGLGTARRVLQACAAHTEANGLEDGALLNARLYPDMFDLTRNVQAATDQARRGIDRLIGVEPRSADDPDGSISGLIERVETTIEQVGAADRAAIDASESRTFQVDLGQPFEFTGRTYVMKFAVPNFLFHVATAYDIARHEGVVLGKRDYITAFMAQ